MFFVNSAKFLITSFLKNPSEGCFTINTHPIYCPTTTFRLFKSNVTHIFWLSIFSALFVGWEQERAQYFKPLAGSLFSTQSNICDVLKTSWKRLEDVSKMSWRRLEDVLKTFLRDTLKASWQDVLKTSWKFLEDVLKTYNQDDYIGFDQDVLKKSWRRLLKTYELGEYIRLDQDVLKTSWRRLLKTKTKDVFKTPSSRWTFAG